MYEQFFGFSATPFSKTIATQDVLQTPSLKEVTARLAMLVRERGIGLVTGEVGSGKSTTVRAFVATLDPNRHVIVQLAAPIASPGALYRSLLLALNQQIPFGAAAQIVVLKTALSDLIANRKTPLIIIDEAHLLPIELVDPLRTLLAADLDSKSLAALILIGQPDIRRTLQLSTLQAFAQRISMRAVLEPLALDATLAYIKHHLSVAGCSHDTPFAEDALRRIADHTQGIPRKINLLASTALIAAAAAKQKFVDDTIVRRAINDIEQI